jgi:hypothetical protein
MQRSAPTRDRRDCHNGHSASRLCLSTNVSLGGDKQSVLEAHAAAHPYRVAITRTPVQPASGVIIDVITLAGYWTELPTLGKGPCDCMTFRCLMLYLFITYLFAACLHLLSPSCLHPGPSLDRLNFPYYSNLLSPVWSFNSSCISSLSSLLHWPCPPRLFLPLHPSGALRTI